MKEFIAVNEFPVLGTMVEQLRETAGFLWEKGWAEGSAGNISVDVTDPSLFNRVYDHAADFELNTSHPVLERHIFLITASGARMRQVMVDPLPFTGLIAVNDHGSSCRALSFGGDRPFHPSSELSVHLAVHAVLPDLQVPGRAVVHGHAHELTALTYLDEYANEKNMNELLRSIHPEMLMFLPEGLGLVPFSGSGSEDLARRTAEKFLSHRVVLWEKHGCIAAGDDLRLAFDKMDIAAAVARIFFYCRHAGFEPRGLNENQIKTVRNPGTKSRP
jgi:rhamnulose-1-phosphate aldolase